MYLLICGMVVSDCRSGYCLCESLGTAFVSLFNCSDVGRCCCNCCAPCSALSWACASSSALLSVNSGSAGKCHCRCALEIPHTIRSRNMSSKVLPKLKCSDNRLSSEANMAIDSPGFCFLEPNLNL